MALMVRAVNCSTRVRAVLKQWPVTPPVIRPHALTVSLTVAGSATPVVIRDDEQGV